MISPFNVQEALKKKEKDDNHHPWHHIAVKKGFKPKFSGSSRAKGSIVHEYIDSKSGKVLKLYAHKKRTFYAMRHKNGKVVAGSSSSELHKHLREFLEYGQYMTDSLWEAYDPIGINDDGADSEDKNDMTEVGGDVGDPTFTGSAMQDQPYTGAVDTYAGAIPSNFVLRDNQDPHKIVPDNTSLPQPDTFMGGVPYVEEPVQTPNDYAPSDYGPGVTRGVGVVPEDKNAPNNDYSPTVAPGNAILPEGFADPTSHPFHNQVTRAGYKHTGSSSALGAATHNYAKGAKPMQLKTTSSGSPSWHSMGKSGGDSNSLTGHIMTNEVVDRTSNDPNKNPEHHRLHSVLHSLGYTHLMSHGDHVQPTMHLYRHDNPRMPHVALYSQGNSHAFDVRKPGSPKGGRGESPEKLKKMIGKYSVNEGLLDFLKPSVKAKTDKPMGSSKSFSPEYRTSHSFAQGHDIDPKTIPVFKPSWQTAGKEPKKQ